MEAPLSIFSSSPLRLILFLCLLIIGGDRAIYGLAQHLISQSQFRFARLYNQTITAEVAIFGNSRAVHAFFAPALADALCRPVVNLGYNGIGIETVATLTLDAADRIPDLRIAIIEVSSLFSTNGQARSFSTFAADSQRLRQLQSTQFQAHFPWNKVFLSLSLNNDIFWRSLRYQRHSDQSWIMRHAMSSTRPTPRSTPNWHIAPADISILSALLEELDRRGIEPLLVVGPYHPMSQRSAAEWPRQVADLLGYPILDLSAAITNPQAFADPIHTNLTGALELIGHLRPSLTACPEPTDLMPQS